jgi:cytochrome c-type biogenesis protein CcmE
MPERSRRARYVVAAVLCGAAVVWLLAGALRENLVYLQPVSRAVEQREEQGTRTFRIGGTVVPGSITETADGVRFDVTEGGATVSVLHHGDPPDLFDDEAPVVCEGRWQGKAFDSRRMLIRHGSQYTPPTEP